MIKVIDQVVTEKYALYNGDCVEVIKGIPDNSIGMSVFSPPFSSLYTYSDSDRDMGNSKGDEEFWRHFGFLVPELYRVLMPGRHCVIHCAQIPAMKERDGYIGLKDFRGDLIRAFQSYGFIFHSEVTIWKDPVVEMQRTKSLGLLWKQIKKDSSRNRMGIPDYLVVMRKPGDNPVQVEHTAKDFPVDQWQEWASPVWKEAYNEVDIEFLKQVYESVWMDINQSNTLQRESAREERDERHICPLQLDVIHRAIELWSAKGDSILSPYMGIGSEGYESIKQGRKFIGIELKESYFKQAVLNMKKALSLQADLFSEVA